MLLIEIFTDHILVGEYKDQIQVIMIYKHKVDRVSQSIDNFEFKDAFVLVFFDKK